MIFKTLFQLLSPAGSPAPLSVLIFHRVLPEADPLFPEEVHAHRFEAICGWLAKWFNVLPLDKAVLHLKEGSLPSRAACITFDDGYADNYRVALPILQRHGLTATFFIATGFLDGGLMWNDAIIETIRAAQGDILDLSFLGLGQHCIGSVGERQVAISALIDQIKYRPVDERVDVGTRMAQQAGVRLPGDLMMTSDDVRSMFRAGMQVGAHTVSHPILARLAESDAHKEIRDSRIFLEELLGARVGLFAYPNGKPVEDYNLQTVEVVRSLGFDAAVSTQWGASRQSDDLFQIRRFTPWDRSKVRFGARLLSNLRSA